jgi:hypothetical protein
MKGALDSQPQVIKFTSTPASSTTKTGRHDIAEILLKVAFKNTKNKKLNHFLHFMNSAFNLNLHRPVQEPTPYW